MDRAVFAGVVGSVVAVALVWDQSYYVVFTVDTGGMGRFLLNALLERVIIGFAAGFVIACVARMYARTYR